MHKPLPFIPLTPTYALCLLFFLAGLVVSLNGTLCYNCNYKEKDRRTHRCLYPSNASHVVNCSRDGSGPGNSTRDLNDKCSFANGSHPDFGFVIVRTCSRGRVHCKVHKERNHVMLTNSGKLVEIFLLAANYCVCAGSQCNGYAPPKGKLAFDPADDKGLSPRLKFGRGRASYFKFPAVVLNSMSIAMSVVVGLKE